MLAAFTAHGSLELSPFKDFFEADEWPCDRQSVFGCLMASFAEDKRFSLEGNHPLDPFWFGPSWVFVEFSHRSYMMDFYIPRIPAQFTEVR